MSKISVDEITDEAGTGAPDFPNGANFGDNDKAVFGAGSDLQIYHDGSRSIIQDNGTGNLRIQANNLELNNADNSKNYLFAANNGAVTLYHNNASKLATTSTGVSVTGTVAATSYTGDGSALTGIAGTPAGAVIYHAANSPPTGFIKANGASLSTTTYADLFAAIGYTFGGSAGSFNVPDLRGEFMRGWDDSRGVDSGRSFGSAQADEVKSHEHRVFRASVHGSSNTGQNDLYRGFGYNDFGTGSVANSGRSGPMFSGGGSETRPRNIALLACIKY